MNLDVRVEHILLNGKLKEFSAQGQYSWQGWPRCCLCRHRCVHLWIPTCEHRRTQVFTCEQVVHRHERCVL